MNNTTIDNLWDSLQVEMSAEFEKIKISLGELKDIQEGLVVDISSVYNNKVSLKVGEKIIANGELVIINDRYGVKIGEVVAENEPEETVQYAQQEPSYSSEAEEITESGANEYEEMPQEMGQEQTSPENDEFNYNDFDIDADTEGL